MSRLFPVLSVAVGVVLSIAGVMMWSIPAALVAAGVGLVTVGVFYRYEEK